MILQSGNRFSDRRSRSTEMSDRDPRSLNHGPIAFRGLIACRSIHFSGTSVPRLVSLAACLKHEPHAPLGLIDKIFQNAGGGDVAVLVADFVALAHGLR